MRALPSQNRAQRRVEPAASSSPAPLSPPKWVSVRWRADFANGLIQVESRNLERPGTVTYTVDPVAVDQALLDEFGKLALGLPNVFRELAKR